MNLNMIFFFAFVASRESRLCFHGYPCHSYEVVTEGDVGNRPSRYTPQHIPAAMVIKEFV